MDGLAPPLAWLAAALDAAGIGRAIGAAALVYPLVNVAHVLGVVLLVGGIGIVDLRLLGAWPALPLPALSRALTPLAVAGLALLALSGAVMFAADAKALAGSATFRWKLALIAVALLNALAFRRLWRGGPPTPGLKALAAGSVAAWLTVAGLGRWIAYS